MNGPQTEPQDPVPDSTLRERSGRHRSDTAPITGPILIGRPPPGLHQEDDLEPKRWPWVVLVLVSCLLSGGGAYTWGRAAGYNSIKAELATTAVFTPDPVPTATVTKTARPSPRPTKTVHRTRTVEVTTTPAPGPTVFRNRTVTATPQPRPAPAATVERVRCYSIDLADYEEIECP